MRRHTNAGMAGHVGHCPIEQLNKKVDLQTALLVEEGTWGNGGYEISYRAGRIATENRWP